MAGVIWYFSTLDKEAVTVVSNVASNIILFGIIMVFIGMAAWKRINVYDAFIEGAKDGFATAVKIIPYLIAILVAIGVFRASGAMEVVMSAITRGIEGLGFNADCDRLFVFCLKIFLVQKSVYEKGGCRYERRGR